MKNTNLMLTAIKEALNSQEPIKCGCVIAKGGKIIAQAHSSQRKDNNATAHAEINALQQAGKILQTKDMKGCTVYSTHEPCTMCLSAFIFSKVQKVVYGIPMSEYSPKRINISTEEILAKSPNNIEVEGSFLIEECRKINKQ